MIKKIIIYNILSIVIPLIMISIIVSILDINNDIGYVFISMLLSALIYTYSFIGFKYNKYFLVIASIFNVALIIIMFFVDKYYYVIPVLLLSFVLGYLSNRIRYFIVLFEAIMYLNIFICYSFNKMTLLAWAAYTAATCLIVYLLKYKRTKIYLYDNYGE